VTATVVVQDQPAADDDVRLSATQVLAWEDIDRIFGDDAWIFSRQDGGIRIVGFLQAVAAGAEIVIGLDDDCHPRRGAAEFVQRHVENLAGMHSPRWLSTCGGLRVRGLPYTGNHTIRGRIDLSLGLWSGTPDLDALTTLSVGADPAAADVALGGRFEPPAGNWIVPDGCLVPVSGMNLAFRSELLYGMYWPIQGRDSPFRRFDDIWGGLTVQKVIEQLRHRIVVGEPHVCHTRASDPLVNLVKEAPGIAAHERYWRLIDELPWSGASPREIMLEFASQLTARAGDDGYLSRWSEAVRVWCRLVDAACG
jgi:hypothetical protein